MNLSNAKTILVSLIVLACPPNRQNFFHQFLELIVPQVPAKAKLSFVDGFKRLQNHVTFPPEYCSRVLHLCIDLVQDSDHNIRRKFR